LASRSFAIDRLQKEKHMMNSVSVKISNYEYILEIRGWAFLRRYRAVIETSQSIFKTNIKPALMHQSRGARAQKLKPSLGTDEQLDICKLINSLIELQKKKNQRREGGH
jgi:hypothetical protein